jgi:hypothetical protein
MFVVAVSLTHTSPIVSVRKDGWLAFELWCRYAARHMVTVHKYKDSGHLEGYAEAEGQYGFTGWHEGGDKWRTDGPGTLDDDKS